MIHTIGDLHLSFGCNKPMNIFNGWRDYEQKLEASWRQQVGPDDTVILCGDLSWGMSLEESLPDFKFIEGLPGKKIILKGNHDYWWNTVSKMNAFFEANGLQSMRFLHNNAFPVENIAIAGTRGWFYDLDETEDKKVLLREAGRLKASLETAMKTGLEPVVFLHYPPIYGDYYCEEMLEVLAAFPVCRCFYGHIHAAGCARAFQGEYNGVEYRLVSADFMEFKLLRVS